MSTNLNRDPTLRIARRFDLNRRRVESLINIYRQSGQSKLPASQRQDTLRSAVVFIHAMLEDLLRELIRWKAPIDNEDFANLLRFQIGPDESKENSHVKQISIYQLAKSKEKNIDKIIAQSINNHLQKRTFNDETQITQAINLLGIATPEFVKFLPKISECVKRRHAIVHRGDRSDHNAITHGKPMSITVSDVTAWNQTVGELGELLFERLPATTPSPVSKKPIRTPLLKVPAKLNRSK